MKVALLTVSDSASAGQASDLSGPLLHKLVAEGGRTVVRADILPDDRADIAAWLCQVCDEQRVDLVLTSGGTGLGPRDITPEATRDVLQVEAPGIAEAIRAQGLAKTPAAMLSRGIAGVRGRTLIINLSGSPRAVTEQWTTVEPIVEHAVATVQGRGHHQEADAARREARPAPKTSSPPPPKPAAPHRAPVAEKPRSTKQTLVGTPLTDLLGEKADTIQELRAARQRVLEKRAAADDQGGDDDS